jgi:hypothetical protein
MFHPVLVCESVVVVVVVNCALAIKIIAEKSVQL